MSAIHRYDIKSVEDLHQVVNSLMAEPVILDRQKITEILHLLIDYLPCLPCTVPIPVVSNAFNDGSGTNYGDGSGTDYTNL